MMGAMGITLDRDIGVVVADLISERLANNCRSLDAVRYVI